jgi:predicted NBD/HSP70 family sugar kinase
MNARRAIDLRRNNSAGVLRMLLDEGPLPRVDLAAKLSLSTGALTRITAEMATHGIVKELEPVASSEAGRRPVPIDINAEAFVTIGVHIGLELTTYGLVDLRGRLIGDPQVAEHGPIDAKGAISATARASRILTDQVGNDAVVIGTGVISGGFVAQDWQVMADDAEFGWKGENLTDLAHAFGPANCVIDNAYRAHSRAEMWFGAARTVDNFIEFFIGNLIGAAIVVNGEFYSGRARAPYITHLPMSGKSEVDCWCSNKSCLASVAGRKATVARAQRFGLRVSTITEVANAARAGNAVARRIMRHRIDSIGQAISILMDVYDPEAVVLAGSFRVLDDVDRIRSVVESRSGSGSDSGRVVVPTELGDSATANVVAAATARLADFYQDPVDSTSRLRSREEVG